MTSLYTRSASANTYDSSVRNLSMRQTGLSNLQENLTSGKRVVRASDDPTTAANAERALTRIGRIATDQRALESQRNAITLAESTLGDVTDALQNFRELVVSAGNGNHSNADRKSIAFQLTGLRDQIVSLSNLKDTNGLPLFSALGSALTPFVGPQATEPTYTFEGLPGQSASQDVLIPFALDGDSAFMMHPTRDGAFNARITTTVPINALSTSRVSVTSTTTVANTGAAASIATGKPNSYPAYTVAFTAVDSTTVPGTTTATYSITENPAVSGAIAPVTVSYASNQSLNVTAVPGLSFSVSGTPLVGDSVSISASASVFSVLDDAIRDIGGAATSNAVSQAVVQALNNIDIGMERVSGVRGQAGDLLTRADRITTNQEKRSTQLESDRSRAEDLDMIKGISDFNNQQTGYQAALQTYAQIQKLSLFNFIG